MQEIILWLEENFNLAIQFLMSGGLFTWVAALYSKFKTQAVETPKSIALSVKSQIETAVKSSINTQLEKLMDSQKTLAESMVLLSQNDAAAKLALIENMKKLKLDTTVLEQAEQVVKQAINEVIEKKENIEQAIKTLEEPIKFL
jgi:translation initiation factor 2B subunit (eIF-2B alpha/beta/delta family)